MDEICRICLDSGASVPLFQSVMDDKSLQMINKFISCTSVQVSYNDTMPKELCSVCADKLDDAYRLKVQAQRSDADLRHRLGLVKIEYSGENIWAQAIKTNNEELEIEKHDDDDNPSYDCHYDNEDGENYADEKSSVNKELDIQLEPHLRETIEKICKSKTSTSSMAGSIKITKIVKKAPKKCALVKKESEDDSYKDSEYAVNIPIAESNLKVVPILRNRKPRKIRKMEPQYTCDVCLKVFSYSRSYGKHIKEEHPGYMKKRAKRFMCDVCGNTFHDRSGLRMHERKHTGDRPFVCTICGKAFIQPNNLERHVSSVHLKEKPYQCQLCPGRFGDSSSLRDHIRNHKGERQYPCSSCDKRFLKRFALARHQLTHSKARPYICKICGGTYTQSNDLKSHVKRAHVGVSTEQRSNYCEKVVY